MFEKTMLQKSVVTFSAGRSGRGALGDRRLWKAAACAAVLALTLGAEPLFSAATAPSQTAVASRPAATPVIKPSVLAGWPIARVEVRGNRPSDLTAIENQIRVTAGSPYNRAEVDVDVRSIASLGRFVTVRAQVIPTEQHQVIVRYIVQERPEITSVLIAGNRHIKDKTIREVLLARTGGAVDQFVYQSDIRAITKLYRSRGFNFVRVVLGKKSLAKGIIKYEITEGPRVRINDVSFVNNVAFPDWYLGFKTDTKSHLWIIRSGYLRQNDLRHDEGEIRKLYQDRGYLDCRVDHLLQYDPTLRRLKVKFIIQHGRRYRVGKVQISGNTAFSTPVLLKKVTMKSGKYWNHDLVKASQQAIADMYGRAGYLYSQVEPQFAYSSRPGIANVTFVITEGKPYHVGRVIIRGNTAVQDHVVRRQVRLFPGGLYDTVAVRNSVNRIHDTRLFPHANITPIGNEPDTRDALVTLQQGQTGRFMIGAGVSTDAGLIGQVSLSQDNFDITDWPHSWSELLHGQAFKGNGQFAQILLEPGTDYQLYKVTFAEPYLWDSPYSFRNSAYFFTELFNSYNLNRGGDRVTFGRRFGDHLSTTLAFRGETVQVGNLQSGVAPEIAAQSGWHFLTSVKPGIAYYTTDSSIFPTRGIVASATWEQYGALGGAYNFSKIDLQFTWYKTIYKDLFGRKTVFAWRNELGFIPLGNSVFFERFYAGGIGSLRGFTYQGVGPREGYNLDPVGGNFLAVTTGEINYPIYQNILRGVVFTDVGDVEPNMHLGTIRADAGLGLRITIPFFGQYPLGIDFAYPFSHGPQDHLEYVSFAFGIPM